jgi:hypothetical protein
MFVHQPKKCADANAMRAQETKPRYPVFFRGGGGRG